MSKNIEERILSMTFNNKGFDKNAKDTLSTLEKLESKLKLSKGVDGLKNVASAVGKVSFAPISAGIDQVQMKFGLMEGFAVSSVMRIVDTVENAGIRMAKALTIEPIMTGFQEYETQINAVQTILSNTESKGSTIDDVNTALDTLNTYADKTIYNFTEMTRNIGTFTAAGVGLEDSVKSIQGIANMAAMSGSNSAQASNAMYQLSQALASGTVKLMDWNSVVNAGMGGELFKNKLKESSKSILKTAESVRAMSAEEQKAYQQQHKMSDEAMDRLRSYQFNVDEVIKKHGNFRESLTEGWITAEVLNDALAKTTQTGVAEYLAELTGVTKEEIEAQQELVDKSKDGAETYDKLAEKMAKTGKITKEEAINMLKFADSATNAATKVKTFTQLIDTLKEAAQSGWTQSWETIIGDYEEAKELLTKISDVLSEKINASSELRNKALEEWDKNKGRDDLIKALSNIAKAVETMVKPISAAFDKIFPQDSHTKAQQLLALTKHLKEFSKTAKDLSEKIAPKFQSALETVFKIAKVGTNIFQALLHGAGRIVSDLFNALENSPLLKGDSRIARLFSTLVDYIYKAAGNTDIFVKAIDKAIDKIEELAKKVSEFIGKGLDKISDSPIGKVFKHLGDDAEAFITKLTLPDDKKNAINGILDKLKSGKPISIMDQNTLKNAGVWSDDLKKLIDSGSTETLSKFIDKLEKLSDFSKSKASSIKDMFKGFSEASSAMKKDGGIKAAGLDAIANIKPGVSKVTEDLANALKHLAKAVEGLLSAGLKSVGSMLKSLFEQISKFDISKVFSAINAGSLAMVSYNLSKFVKSLTEIGEGLGEAVEGIGKSLEGVLKSFAMNNKTKGLKNVAEALLMVVGALFILSTIDPKQLAAAMVSMKLIFKELSNMLKTVSDIESGLSGLTQSGGVAALGAAMTEIGVALILLSAALKVISTIDAEQMVLSLMVLEMMMLGITECVERLKKVQGADKKLMRGAGSLISFALALVVVASAVKILSTIEPTQLAVATGAMVALMATMSACAIEMSTIDKDKMMKGAGGLIAFALAIVLLASSVKILATMDMETMAVSLAGVIALMSYMALLATMMDASKMKMSSGLGMIGMATSIVILAEACKKLAELNPEQLAKGIGSITVLLGELVLTFNLLPKDSATLRQAAAIRLLALGLSALIPIINAFAGMKGADIAKSLGAVGALFTEMVVALNFMPSEGNLVKAAAGMVLFAFAANAMIPPLMAMKLISWESIAKGFILVAGAVGSALVFATLAEVVMPIIPAMLALAGTMTLVGAAMLAFGVGVAALGVGLTLIKVAGVAAAASMVASWLIIVKGWMSALPILLDGVKQIIVGVCDMLIESAPKIGEALKTLVVMLTDVLVECIPNLVSAVLSMTMAVLDALVEQAPVIIDKLFNVLVLVINKLTEKIPELIASFKNLAGAFVQAFADAFGKADTSQLLEMAEAFGVVALSMNILAGVAALTPAAMVGVLAVGAVIAEMAVVIAAIGALKETPGFTDLMSGGADILGLIGTAIGNFLGGIISGFASEATNALPTIGTNLSGFAEGAKGFIEEMSKVPDTLPDSVGKLVGAMILLMGEDILEKIKSWFFGKTDLSGMTQVLTDLGTMMVSFNDSIKTLSEDDINRIKLLSDSVDGVVGIAERVSAIDDKSEDVKSLTNFSDEMTYFGESVVKMAGKVKDITDSDVSAIKRTAEAATAVSDLAKNLPTSGGWKSSIFGSSNMKGFSSGMIALGGALNSYAASVKSFTEDSKTKILYSIDAGKAILGLSNEIPNTGGLKNLFSGDSGMTAFVDDMTYFAKAIVSYATEIHPIKVTDITKIRMSADAARGLAEICAALPPVGDVSSVSGYSRLTNFGADMGGLADGLIAYADKVGDIKASDKAKMDAATATAQGLADLAAALPGGVSTAFSTFTGISSLQTFAADIEVFGGGIKAYMETVSSIKGTNIGTKVQIAANATNGLVAVANAVPPGSSIKTAFTGFSSLETFASDITTFGWGLKAYTESVAGITATEDQLNGAMTVANGLVSLSDAIPEGMSFADAFTGFSSLTTFGEDIKNFGDGLKSYADSVSGLSSTNEDFGSAKAAAEGLCAVAELVPENGGLIGKFKGFKSLDSFGDDLKVFGDGLKSYSDSVKDVDSEAITASLPAAEGMAGLAENVPEIISVFGNITDNVSGEWGLLGQALKSFADGVSGIDSSGVASAATAAPSIAAAVLAFKDVNFDDYDFTGAETDLIFFSSAMNAYSANCAAIALDSITTAYTAASYIKSTLDVFNTMDFTGLANAQTFFSNMGTLDTSILESFTSALTSALPGLKLAITAFTTEFQNGFVAGVSAALDTISTSVKTVIVSAYLKASSGAQGRIKTVGRVLMSYLASGIKANTSAPSSAIASVMNHMMSVAQSYNGSLYSTGAHLMNGLAQGINANAATAINAMSSAVTSVNQKAQSVAKVASPSRFTKWIGKNQMLGLAIGIAMYAHEAINAARDAMTDVNNTFNETIGDLYSEDVVYSPTIAPVLDMSNVEDGLDGMNSLFSGNGIIAASSIELNAAVESQKIQQLNQIIAIGNSLIDAMKRNGDVYLDGQTLIGWVNRGLGGLA